MSFCNEIIFTDLVKFFRWKTKAPLLIEFPISADKPALQKVCSLPAAHFSHSTSQSRSSSSGKIGAKAVVIYIQQRMQKNKLKFEKQNNKYHKKAVKFA